MQYYFKLNYPPFLVKLLLGKARLYDFDPEGNYRELGVKKILKITLKNKQSLENRRQQRFTSFIKFISKKTFFSGRDLVTTIQ